MFLLSSVLADEKQQQQQQEKRVHQGSVGVGDAPSCAACDPLSGASASRALSEQSTRLAFASIKE